MSHILIPNADFAGTCVGYDYTSSLTAQYASIDHRCLTGHSLGTDTKLAQSVYSDVYGNRNRYDSAGHISHILLHSTDGASYATLAHCH